MASAQSSIERPLPHNLEAERSILGAVLLDNHSLNAAVEKLRSEDFFLPQHRQIFERMIQLAEKQQAIDGIKDMGAKIPGIKNIWIKGERMQPRDFNAAYAIEFRDRAAADAYAESAVHAAWEAQYVPLRAASVSIQVTNP